MRKIYKYNIKDKILTTPRKEMIFLTNNESIVMELLMNSELVTDDKLLVEIPQYRANIFRFRKKTNLNVKNIKGRGYILLDKIVTNEEEI